MLVEPWIQRAAENVTRHVKTARSPCFQSTAEFKIVGLLVGLFIGKYQL